MNQPPQTEKQTGKRIVSKNEYVRTQYRRAHGYVSAAVGYCFFPYAIYTVLVRWKHHTSMHDFSVGNGFAGLVFIGMGVGAYFVGQWLLERTRAIEPVVPLTRANTVDLPAPDSLVRASVEPVQEQQAVLLRAATETSERHEEQLVRASAGRTE